MHRWRIEAARAVTVVSDTPESWVAGALAWAATGGPVALLLAVVPFPTLSDLTSTAARAFSSGSWPWNVVASVAGALVAAVLALVLVAAADVALIDRRAAGTGFARSLRTASAVTLLACLPAAASIAALVAAVVIVAPGEINAPDAASGGPAVRTVVRVWPLALLVGVSAATAGAFAAAARLEAIRGAGLGPALGSGARTLAAARGAAVIHAAVGAALRLAFLVLATVLLAVLWDPIGTQLAAGAGFGAGEMVLLVGFAAIWICLVLGGGAIHAWWALTWAGLLGPATRSTSPLGRVARRKETSSAP
jgi:hypothetical protein